MPHELTAAWGGEAYSYKNSPLSWAPPRSFRTKVPMRKSMILMSVNDAAAACARLNALMASSRYAIRQDTPVIGLNELLKPQELLQPPIKRLGWIWRFEEEEASDQLIVDWLIRVQHVKQLAGKGEL